MAAKTLHIAPGLDIPAEDFIESKSAILGASGGGKSGALKVIEEELVECRLPFIVFDPAGIAWGLRSSADGREAGLPILVVGGEHGDVPLNKHAGAEMADEVVRTNCQVIFDLSDESTDAYRTFLTDFCEELYRAQGRTKTPRLLIIDEAHEILPQQIQKVDARTYGAVKRIVTRGRNRGLGVCLVSQRPADIAKTVLTQCGTLLVFGLLGTPDRKAVGDWVAAWGGDAQLREFDSGLAALKPQECWFWSPRDFRRFEKVRIRDFRTFHPDYTNLRKKGLLDVQPVTTDVASLVSLFSKEAAKVKQEKVDASDLPRLRAEVGRLKGENERLRSQPPKTAAHPAGPSRKEIEAPLRQEIAMLSLHLRTANRRIGSARGLAEQILQLEAIAAPDPVTATPVAPAPRPAPVGHGPGRPYQQTKFTARPDRPLLAAGVEMVEGEIHIKSGARRMLQELASRHPLTLTYSQLATLAGFTPSGGTATTYYSTLRKAGYLEEDREGNVRVTQEGLDFLGADVPPTPTTHAEVMGRWRQNLKAGTYKMLEAVAERYPEPITNEELAEVSGFAVSGGTYTTYRGILARNSLIEIADGEIRAAAVLFPEDVPSGGPK